MCKSKSHGGMRCPSQLNSQRDNLAGQKMKLEETKEELENARESKRSAKRLDRRIASIETRLAIIRHRLADLDHTLNETADGQQWLENMISDPETPEAMREIYKFRLAKARENGPVQKRFVAETSIKNKNIERAMKQAGFSESDVQEITERYLNRDMNRLPYSTAEASAERTAALSERRNLIARINKLKTEVRGADYLDEDEKEEAYLEIDADHEAEMLIVEEKFRLAKRKYDATDKGLEFLKMHRDRLVAERQMSEASELQARIRLAEREIRTRSNERNARGSLKRAISKAANRAGSDPQKVWDACKNIKAVNLDGTPYSPLQTSDSRIAAPTVHLTVSDYDSLAGTVSNMKEYRNVPVKDAVRDLMRRRILENPLTRQETDTPRNGSHGRYRTKGQEKRNQPTYPALTVREYQKVKSIAKTLEMTPAAYMRAMALGEKPTLPTVQSMRGNWNRKIGAPEDALVAAS